MDYAEYLQAKNETRVIRDINGQQMLATIEASTTASKAYAVGDYLIANDKIYKVTAAIASGGTITVGTNVAEAKVGTELTDLNRQISELEDTVSTTQIINTASGAIASFADGADGMPIRKLVANIEPVQDLHGYANPWPAGGGVNKFDQDTIFGNAGAQHESDGSWYFNNVGIILSGTPIWQNTSGYSGQITISLAHKTLNETGSQGARFKWKYSDDTEAAIYINNSTSFLNVSNTSESGKTVSALLWDYGSSINSTWLKDVQVELNATATSFAPYSNICPISGHTGASVTRTGVNVWDEEWEIGGINTSGEPATATNRIRSKNFVDVTPNGSYFFKSPTGVYLWAYDKSKSYIGRLNNGNLATGSITVPSNCYYIKFVPDYPLYGTTYNHDISINYPSTDTAYHPYTGNQLSITFPSEAGTVYGGTLTLNPDRTGKLVVDRAIVELSTLDFVYYSQYVFFTAILDGRKPGILNLFSNVFKTETGNWGGTAKENVIWT